MRLVKNEFEEYWVNNQGVWYGEYKSWHINGQIEEQCFYFNDELHGEYKWWNDNGEIRCHEYMSHGEVVRDLKEDPVDDEDKFLLTLEYGGQWLCD